MPSEIYLYSPIYSEIAQRIAEQIESMMDEEITLRVNSPGGSVFAGWSIAAKMAEHGNVHLIIDGAAMSMAMSLFPYAKSVTATDVAQFMMHRADMFVYTDEEKQLLARINKDMLAKYKSKVDAELFKSITGLSLEEVFSSEDRKDIYLSAKQAKQIGLVDKITKLNPVDLKAYESRVFDIAATGPMDPPKPEPKNPINTMTLEEIKAQNPAVFAQIIALGVAQEKDRVGAWMAFQSIDPEAVATGIEGTDAPSATAVAKFQAKAISANLKSEVESGSAKPIATNAEATALTEDQKKIKDFQSEVNKNLGIKEK